MDHRPNAHARPPDAVKAVYKRWQKASPAQITAAPDLIDLQSDHASEELLDRIIPPAAMSGALHGSEETPIQVESQRKPSRASQSPCYSVNGLPGLLIYPSLFSKDRQIDLLHKLLHRDLANPAHKTNVHLHHTFQYPPATASFFDSVAQDIVFEPKETIHASFDTNTFLSKKLRWTTLGGQYDWTAKRYPDGSPPAFPPDIKAVVESHFPMKAEAAIANLYSPSDTLSIHRDVSEECAMPLVSISLGCDAIFVVGVEGAGTDETQTAAIRLRSGDAVLMSGEARYAWHGVPKVLAGTCPQWLGDWPAIGKEGTQKYSQWKGWMSGKRVNLNVRQMFADV